MTPSANFPAADLQRLLALAEQNHDRIEKLYQAVMGDGNPRDGIMYRLQAAEHQVKAMRQELTDVHTCLDDLEGSYARDRNRLAGAIAIILVLWSILTFIGFQQLTTLLQSP